MSTNSIPNDERRLAFVGAIVLSAMVVAVSLGTPGHGSLLPPCPLHALTGFFCPGCGTTRALYYLVHGHPLKALAENALSMSLLPFILSDLGATITRRWPTLGSRLRPWSMWVLIAVVILFAVLRNLPMAPFTHLAPTDIP
jgi:disulfide bond formation protein DsbB